MTWLRTTGLRLLLSIGLGFALWVFVSFTQNPDQSTSFDSVPVDIEGLEPSLVVVDQQGLPRTNRPVVDIAVEGPDATLQTMRQSDLRAFVDLSGRGPGDHNNVPVNVVPSRAGLARMSLQAEPAFLSFRLEQEITRTVPLTIEVAGNLPFSFEKGQPSAVDSRNQPVQSVLVRGPQSRVERVTLARLTADIDRLTANYSSPRPVEPLAQDGQVVSGVTADPLTLKVLVPIVSSAGVKRVPVVPRVVGSPASGYLVTSVAVDPQFVRLTGSAGPLDNIQSIGTDDVDLGGASQAISRTVALRPPQNIGLDSGEPSTATVVIQIAPIARPFQITLPVSIQVAEVPDGLQASASPQVVQLTVTGSAQQISALNPATILGSVSASGRGAGSYAIEPTFRLPEGITIVGQPPRVTLTLRPPPTPTPELTPTELAPTTGPPALTPTVTTETSPTPPTPTP